MNQRQPASLLPSAAAQAHIMSCASCRELARRLAKVAILKLPPERTSATDSDGSGLHKT
jgi:predicted anti-sigma-YlaC factor YlaD